MVDGSPDVSPISVVGAEPPLLHPRYPENGRVTKIKDQAPVVPVDRPPIKVEELENYVLARQNNDYEDLRKEYKV